MQESITIEKNPNLPESNDYRALKTKGLEYIQQLGSKLWTDYNKHDPGITLLEALCFAITDLGYRASFDIKDILAEPDASPNDHERQGFFTARDILTINPCTINDFRKLLIDLEGVKNAWFIIKTTSCEGIDLFANCQKSILQYDETEHEIFIKGIYDVLIEFEDDERAGNLNSGKIKYNFVFQSGLKVAQASCELRLPSWFKLDEQKETYKEFRNPESIITSVSVSFISGNKGDNTDIPESELANALRRPVYVTFSVEFKPDKDQPATSLLQFEDVPLSVWFNSSAERKELTLSDLKTALEDSSSSGVFAKYLDKIKKADEVINLSSGCLHSHRNLCEDFCSIKAVQVQDIGVCADIEVGPSADIEKVIAEAYFQIDQYFSPDLKFYSLNELLGEGKTVDEIFEGPALNNGFLDTEQLKSTQLKSILYSSDIINILMDIPGIISVKNFVLTKYNEDGVLIESHPWQISVTENFQPRLYLEGTKFLIFKNGLPFLPDKLELQDTLQVIKGRHAQPRFSETENDIPVPEGTFFDLDDYFPVQYSLPQTYGTGPEGLPSKASPQRRSQAKQLKTYLIFFEQLLVNYLAQLSNIKELYAIDTEVTHSYFSKFLDESTIVGTETDPDGAIQGIYKDLDADVLQGLSETNNTFLNRRNRFLDHLMARFAENFNEYALMLYSYIDNKALANDELIKDKVAFLKDFPFMSSNRFRSFNYKDSFSVCSNDNIAGLKNRIQRLLGFDELNDYFELYEEKDTDDVYFEVRWRLRDENGKIFLSSSTKYSDPLKSEADKLAKAEIEQVKKYFTDPARYEIKKNKKWVLNLLNEDNEVIATRKQAFNLEEEAEAARDELISFAEEILLAEKIFIVEHLLLRPRNAPDSDIPDGDALMSICLPSDCSLCGEEDPYSFRMTIVMNGEEGFSNKGIEFRRFAERTIRMETPAHLGLKVCWVSKEQLQEFEEAYCSWLSELSKSEPDKIELSNRLKTLIEIINNLKNVYPPASLHDCKDGNDENRVYLNNTII